MSRGAESMLIETSPSPGGNPAMAEPMAISEANGHCEMLGDAERSQRAWALLASLLLLAGMATPFFLGRVYIADDLGEFHLPLRDFYARQLAAGEPFDWMPTLFHGFYVTGDGQLGGYHPLHQALYRWLPLGVAFDLEILLSYPWMFLGSWLFLRRRLGSTAAGCWGAMVWCCSSFCMLHFVHPNGVAVIGHLPWLLWLTETAVDSPTRHRAATSLAGIAILTGSQVLLGYPQYVWLSACAELAFAVWLTRGRLSNHAWPRLGAAKALGLLVGGVQLLPTLEALGESTRAQADSAFFATGSLHPLNLAQLVAPYLFKTRVVGQNTHELGLYVGAAPIMLCFWLLINRQAWRQFRGWIVAVVIFATLSLLMAMGEHGGLHRALQWIPGVNAFRFPCRAVVLFQLAIAALSATALVLMRHREHAERQVGVALPTSIAIAITCFGYFQWSEHCSPLWLVAAGPALVAAGAWLVREMNRQRPWAFAALALFTALDLGAYGLSYAIWPRTVDLHQFAADADAPHDGARIATLDDPSGLRVGNRALLRGVSRIDGYAGLEPRRVWAPGDRLGQLLSGAQFSESASGWQPLEGAAPRARLVTRVAPSSADMTTDPMLRSQLLGNLAAVDPAAYSQLAAALDATTVGDATTDMATVVQDRPGRLTVALSTPSPRLLVTTESYHPGWRAVIDEQPTSVIRVNGDFLGLAVPAGAKRLELTFSPRSRAWGLGLSCCGLGLLVSRWLAGVLPARTRPPSSAHSQRVEQPAAAGVLT